MATLIITLILSIALLVVWVRWRQAVRADYIMAVAKEAAGGD